MVRLELGIPAQLDTRRAPNSGKGPVQHAQAQQMHVLEGTCSVAKP